MSPLLVSLVLGSGGGGGNPFDQELNTTDIPSFAGLNFPSGGLIDGQGINIAVGTDVSGGATAGIIDTISATGVYVGLDDIANPAVQVYYGGQGAAVIWKGENLSTTRYFTWPDKDGTPAYLDDLVAPSGVLAPTTTPSYLGQLFVDTVTKKVYAATGTASVADWTLLN